MASSYLKTLNGILPIFRGSSSVLKWKGLSRSGLWRGPASLLNIPIGGSEVAVSAGGIREEGHTGATVTAEQPPANTTTPTAIMSFIQ
jgi:hypothetical protein